MNEFESFVWLTDVSVLAALISEGATTSLLAILTQCIYRQPLDSPMLVFTEISEIVTSGNRTRDKAVVEKHDNHQENDGYMPNSCPRNDKS